MSHDVIFVFGLIISVLALPSLINAFSSSASPRTGMLLLIVGLSMAGWATIVTPSKYTLQSIPDVFVKVFADIVR